MNRVPHGRGLGSVVVVAAVVVVGLPHSQGSRAQEPGPSTPSEPASRLAEMRQVLQRIVIAQGVSGNRRDVERAPDPLYRWNDPTRRLNDAALWVWGSKGRPVAAVAIELYPEGTQDSRWSMEFVALGPGPIAGEFKGPFVPYTMPASPAGTGNAWNPREPDIGMKPVPDAPVLGATEAARLRQLRAIAERFGAHEINRTRNGDQRYELRLLPRPVLRYADADAGLLDGALFVIAHGTNPESLLLVEARSPGPASSPAWSYGLVRMSRAALFVSLDGREVWTQPYAEVAVPDDSYFIIRTLRSKLKAEAVR